VSETRHASVFGNGFDIRFPELNGELAMNRFALFTVLIALGLASMVAHSAPDTHAEEAASHVEDAAHAAGHGDDHGGAHHAANPIAPPKEGVYTGITAIVLFLIVFGILSVVVWPKIVQGLDERNEKIKGEIAAAESARQQAKEALDEYEKNLAEARAQAQQMLEETKSQQQELASQLKAQADTELTEMREKAKADIDAAKKQALNELYSESVNLATVMAGKILQREVSVNDEQRLMEESLAELKTVNS
jgi:F-type H+-transporting ATPase subunit b